MRLIDADKLKEKKEYSEERHEYIVSVAQIDWQPTIQPQGIDKDRLIEELEKLKLNKLMDIKSYSVMSHTLDLVKDIINQQPQTGWIPVSEKLPEEDGKYLCTHGMGWIEVLKFSNDLFSVDHYDFFRYRGYKQKGFYDYDSEYGYSEIYDMKAWMPLPQPFKESE